MNKYCAYFILLISMGSVLGNIQNYYLIDGLHEDNNVVKIWFTALGLLDEYDKGLNAGFEIKFDCTGKHFNPERGPNWWEYYFNFHSIGSPAQSSIQRVPRYKRSTLRFNTACTMSAERGHYLINKYMHLQPSLENQLEQIKFDYWSKDTPVIGIYYQNPIIAEAQRAWNPVELCDRVKEVIKNVGPCKIFFFTDLEDFATNFIKHFGPECMQIPCIKNTALTTAAERGEHELLTMFLLSQCSLVIAPGSYQSIGAKMINPALELIELDTFPYALT